jgi:hypothetical protein
MSKMPQIKDQTSVFIEMYYQFYKLVEIHLGERCLSVPNSNPGLQFEQLSEGDQLFVISSLRNYLSAL